MRLARHLLWVAALGAFALISRLDDGGPSLAWLLACLAIAAAAALLIDGTVAAGKGAWRRSLAWPKRADAIAWLGVAVVSWPAGFFLAGAVGFPLLDSHYRWTFLVTAGLANVSWGIESVMRLGHIETCGLLSGNCAQHDVRWIGVLLWLTIAALALAARRRSRRTAR